MSIINFMLYSNGTMFFHKSVDVTGYSQDAKFLQKVPNILNGIVTIALVECVFS